MAEIESQYASGLVTQGEKYNKVVDIWLRANDLVARSMMDGISKETVVNKEGESEEQASLTAFTCTPIPVREARQLRFASLRVCVV